MTIPRSYWILFAFIQVALLRDRAAFAQAALPGPYYLTEPCRYTLPPGRRLSPLPLLRVVNGADRAETIVALKGLGIAEPDRGLPALSPATARVSNAAFLVVGGGVHEWLLPVGTKGWDRMFVGVFVRSGGYYIDVGYGVSAGQRIEAPTGFDLLDGSRAPIVAEILERVRSTFPKLDLDEKVSDGRHSCAALTDWDDLQTSTSAASVRALSEASEAEKNAKADASGPVYAIEVERIKGGSCSETPPTCEPVVGLQPAPAARPSPDVGPRRCRGWRASCRYEVPERLVAESFKELVGRGYRFQIRQGPRADSTGLARVTTVYERLVCASSPDATWPVATRDEDVDCAKVAKQAESEFLRDVPSAEDVLATSKANKPCKLVTTAEEWRGLQNGRLPKGKKPAQCSSKGLAISYPVVIRDGRTKNYPPRECSGVSAFTHDVADGSELYSIGFAIRNSSKAPMSVSVGDFFFVARDGDGVPTSDTISVAKYHPRATGLACQGKQVNLAPDEEAQIEIVYPSAKPSPWLLINPKAGFYLDISRTAFEDPNSRTRR